MKQYLIPILLGLSVWSGTGFLVGILVSANERQQNYHWDYSVDEKHPQKVIEPGRSGCVYKSIAPLLNPGYVIGCELFRKRFEKEGIEKVFQK